MNQEKYFESLTMELKALKDRVRNFINDRHWLTDGEWKESVLRSMLRRNLPSSFGVGRGFIITPENQSTQIDILVFDLSKPLLFGDGDLVFVTTDAVKAAIEVKTKISKSELPEVIERVSNNANLVRSSSPTGKFFGIFSYEETRVSSDFILETVKNKARGRGSRIVDCMSFGDSTFLRFWNIDPINQRHLSNHWHLYKLRNRAPGYFIHNVVESVCPESVNQNEGVWFPPSGKESSKIGEIGLKDD